MLDLYMAVNLITILVLLITIAEIMTNDLVKKRTKIRAVVVSVLIAASALGECIGVFTNGAPEGFIVLHKIAKVIEFSLAPGIGVAVAIAYGVVKRPKTAIVICILHGLFQCVAVNFEWVFRIDSQNIYHREKLYVIYIIVFIVSVIYSLLCVMRNGKEYQVSAGSVLILTWFMVLVGIGIQFLYSAVRIDYLCIAIGNMLLFSQHYKIMLQIDAVTRLLNRRCYDVSVSDMGSHAVILFFDIDKFKEVNDTYGHSVGDICLKRVAEQLRTVYGKCGLCYRTGGDEFCVILQDSFDRLEELNDQFTAAIKQLQKKDSVIPDVSMGYAYYDASVSHIRNVIEEADAMLYRNKKRL